MRKDIRRHDEKIKLSEGKRLCHPQTADPLLKRDFVRPKLDGQHLAEDARKKLDASINTFHPGGLTAPDWATQKASSEEDH